MTHHMSTTNLGCLLALVTAIAFTGCVAAEKSPEATEKPAAAGDKPAPVGAAKADGQVYRGWYMEQAGQGMFQPCGQSRQWRVDSPELRTQAKDFGLQQDTPVYVRLFVTQSAGGEELSVSRVEQFGSPTPVRDCAMTGVVMPAPAGE